MTVTILVCCWWRRGLQCVKINERAVFHNLTNAIGITHINGFVCIKIQHDFIAVLLQRSGEMYDVLYKLFSNFWMCNAYSKQNCMLLIQKAESASGLLTQASIQTKNSDRVISVR